MSELEFQTCLKEINNGNKNALKEIYDYYGHAIYSYAVSIVKNEALAQDICQEVFIKIWNNSNKYKKNNNHKSWIMTLTKNRSIDYLRKYKKEELREEFYIAEYRNMENYINNKMEIKEALSMLQLEEQEVLVLHIICDLTFKSISELLNKPLGTVTWRYREAINKLKKIMIL